MSFQSVRNHIRTKARSARELGSDNLQMHGFGGISGLSTSGTARDVKSASRSGGGNSGGNRNDAAVEENFAGKYSHLTSSCKSDLFLLQMRKDKLHRLLTEHSNMVIKKEFTNNVTLGEAEIQKVSTNNEWETNLQECILFPMSVAD